MARRRSQLALRAAMGTLREPSPVNRPCTRLATAKRAIRTPLAPLLNPAKAAKRSPATP